MPTRTFAYEPALKMRISYSRASRGRQEPPGAARGRQEPPGAARSRQKPPGVARSSPEAARSRQEPSEKAQRPPEAAQRQQMQPKKQPSQTVHPSKLFVALACTNVKRGGVYTKGRLQAPTAAEPVHKPKRVAMQLLEISAMRCLKM